LRIPTKREVLLFPASSLALGAFAFWMANAIPGGELRLTMQAVLTMLGVLDVTYYSRVTRAAMELQPGEPTPEPEQEPAAPSGFQPVMRRVPNLGEPVTNFYATASLNLVQKDLRWQEFCKTVLIHQTPMTQAKWTGDGRQFSKPEFSAQMGKWEDKKIVKLKNPKNRKAGFILNGGQGRRYFSDVANGKEWIVLPHSD
jgi:hypothetical protein